jgi:hypothetical protein
VADCQPTEMRIGTINSRRYRGHYTTCRVVPPRAMWNHMLHEEALKAQSHGFAYRLSKAGAFDGGDKNSGSSVARHSIDGRD